MKRAIAIASGLLIVLASLVLSVDPVWANESRSTAPEGAKVYLITPQDGDVVSSPFTVKFGLSGMGVAPAGVEKSGTGHHHLLIDLAELPDLDTSLQATDQIKHFGGGQTETIISLPPGEHTLQLLLANYIHVPYNPPVVSEPVTIRVE
ncbi:MAG: DUF4399 domain-containing protein [Cyanobacteria bacterium P01_H01_bin.162]